MTKNYRAIVASCGFRNKYWDIDEIAEQVTPEEEKDIPPHFVLVDGDDPVESEPEEEEINTLSQLQEKEYGRPTKAEHKHEKPGPKPKHKK
jgi:hypothetical protein